MYADRVEETSTTQGTGALQLGGAPTGRRTFIAGIGAGNSCYACATDGAADWELFEGTVNAGAPPSITRGTILASTNGGSAVNWGPGVKSVQCVPLAESYGPIGNRHSFGTAGGTAGAYTLSVQPAPRAMVDGMLVWMRANHSSPAAGATLNLNAKGAKSIRVRDGTWPIGLNDIVTNQVVGLLYDQSSDTWRLVSSFGLDEITMIRSTDATTAFGPYVEAYRKANLATNMVLGGIRCTADNTSGTKINNLGDMYMTCETTTLGAESCSWNWETIQAGTVAVRGYIRNGMVLGAPTGGDKGLGTLNATAVYDDNSLLTCYPLELAIHGTSNVEAWDRSTHGRLHEPVRQFLKNWKGWLDPRSYSKFWRDEGHLPSMPSPQEWQERKCAIPLGELVQRLWEVVDTQAVHIDRLATEIEELRCARRGDAGRPDAGD